MLGDIGHVHPRQEFGAVVLVKFHEHVGLHLFREELESVFGFVEVEVLIEFGNVGGVEVGKLFADGFVGAVGYDFAQVREIFRSEFFHDVMRSLLW